MADTTLNRRRLLGTLAGAGTASVAGCPLFSPGSDGTPTQVGAERTRRLAEQFAAGRLLQPDTDHVRSVA